MDQKNERLLNQSVGKLLFSLSLPAIAAQLVNLLYNIVDRMYIGRIEGIGTQALTGVGVAFPIIMLISAFAALIGMGGAPLASIQMGAKNKERAEKILGNCFAMILIISVVLTAVFLIWREPILMAFGASESTITYAVQYLEIYLIGTIFVQISLGLNNFINAQGFAKIGMYTVVIGAIINIVLDPIFIFIFHMGVRGAALATILSQAVSAIWVMKFLTGKKGMIHIHRSGMNMDARLIGNIIALGISPFIMQSTECLVSIVFNTQLKALGGDLYVGAMVIMSSIMQFVMMPLMGLTQGAQPIVGFNYGAKQYQRVKDTVKLTLKIGVGYTVAMWAVCVFAPSLLSMLFTGDAKLQALSDQCMRIYFFGTIFFGAQIVCQNAFVALGQAKISMCMALLRKIVVLIPLIYLIPAVTGLGVDGVFIAQPIADFTATFCTVLAFVIISRRILNHPQPEAVSEQG